MEYNEETEEAIAPQRMVRAVDLNETLTGNDPSELAERMRALHRERADDVAARMGGDISVSATGGMKEVKLERHDLIPQGALRELAEHYGVGSEKYDDHNWRRGYDWSKSYSALQRHARAFWEGEDIDPQTGSKHITAVAWHAFTLMTFMEEHPDFDDRWKGVVPEAPGQ